MSYPACVMQKIIPDGHVPSDEELESFRQESVKRLLSLADRCVVSVKKGRPQQPDAIVAEFMSE